MANKPLMLAQFEEGKAIGAIDHLVDTMNWLIGWSSNLRGESGVSFQDGDTDHPILKASLTAGNGIKIEDDNGSLKISLSSDDDKDKPYDSGNSQDVEPSGGNASREETGGSDGDSSGGNTNGSPTGGGQDGGSNNTTSDNGSSCNTFSGGMSNDSGDNGMSNIGDNCSSVNGW